MKNLTIVDAKAKNPNTGQFEDGVWGVVGLDGVGIRSITKTSTSGLIDTYTIIYTDNNTSIFTVSNGETITNVLINNNDELIVSLNSGRTINAGTVQSKITPQNKLDADLVDDTNATNKFVTASDKTSLSALESHIVFDSTSKTYYFQQTQPANPQDGDIWIG